jgi:hypothetical protein
MKWMESQRGRLHWTDTDLVQILSEREPGDENVLFVDVGGNVGTVCVELRKQAPDLKGRVINQDLPHVVEQTIEYPGVERSAHDFWTPQVIKGWSVLHSVMLHLTQNPRSECLLHEKCAA